MKIRLERGKNMKRKNGFTLIELLAVIVILAIIALIAVPVVMNIISRANKSAFKDSAYGVLKAGENYYMNELLDAQEMTSDKVFDFSKDTSELEINGSKPTNGKMIVNTTGKVAMAIHNGKHCVTKGFNDDDVTISDDIENCKIPGYSVGDVVYYNPVEDKICTDYVEANSATGVKEGCMRWYVYATDGGKAKLILDHNTTGKVAWLSWDKYKELDPTETSDMNSYGALTLMEQLDTDTTNWKVKADIITAEEVLSLLPYYQNLSPSDKQLFLNPTEENTSVIYGYFDALEAALDDVNANIQYEEDVEVWKAQNEYLVENHSNLLLPKYMYEDIIGTCENACNEEDVCYVECGTYGYWTQTPDGLYSGATWRVDYVGTAGGNSVGLNDTEGLRPVITLSK